MSTERVHEKPFMKSASITLSIPKAANTATTVERDNNTIINFINLSKTEYLPTKSTMAENTRTTTLSKAILISIFKIFANKPTVTIVTAAKSINIEPNVSKAKRTTAHFPILA